jgi:hypothetical protein
VKKTGDRTVWDDVDDLVEKGESPVIKLAPVFQVPRPKRPIGRPRVRPIDDPKGHKSAVMQTSVGSPMKCRNRGCSMPIYERRAAITCADPRCAKELLQESEIYVAILTGKMDPRDLPMAYRSRGQRQKDMGRDSRRRALKK